MKATHTPAPWTADGRNVYIPVYNDQAGKAEKH